MHIGEVQFILGLHPLVTTYNFPHEKLAMNMYSAGNILQLGCFRLHNYSIIRTSLRISGFKIIEKPKHSFVAPIDGRFQFNVVLSMNYSHYHYYYIWLQVDHSNYQYFYVSESYYYDTRSIQLEVELKKGQTVDYYLSGGNNLYLYEYSYIEGKLVF